MKKYIISILFFAFTATAVRSQQQCMLTSPAAASAWIAGNTMPIQWNAGAFTGNVNLSLIDYSINYPNGQVVVTIATNVANSGTYNWLIPNTLPAKCTYGLYVENVIKTNWCYGPGNICISPVAVASGCCPKFSLGADFQPCDTTCKPSYPNGVGVVGNPGGGAGAQMMQACKNITHTYTVYPNLPGFIYTWTVVGGTPNIYNGNPIAITWGNSSQGFIQVIITSADGTCRDTIKRAVCLVDGPVASFTYFPNPVCLSPSFVQFTSTSVGGSSYYWDFGDGSSSTLQNPTHAYATAANYTVILTVSTASGGSGGVAVPDRDCKCKDTASAIITVSNLQGIEIHQTDSCKRMLCTGDTTKYCTSTTGCTGLNWVVNGGSIISGQGTTCITVVWNQPSTYPTTVTLNANCPNTCGNTATINVPVLYPALPIQGPKSVCYGSTTNYSLPVLPGTFYKWTLSGGGNILGADSNINFINVNWTVMSGTYYITCNYHNPFSGCSGVSRDTITIRPKFTINGPAQSCVGNTASFFAAGTANWNVIPTIGYTPPGSPAGTFLGPSFISLTWGAAGTYVINAVPTVPGNFCTPSATTSIVVNPTPVVNPVAGPAVVCPNQLYNYTASSNIPGGNYTWTFTTGTGTITPYGPNNSMASVSFTGLGPWTLQATQTVNNCSGFNTISVTKVPAPTGITLSGTVCSGGLVTATVTGGTAPYTWTSTPGAVITGGQGTAVATFTVNSAATLTVSNCGGSFSTNVPVTPATVSLTSTSTSCTATITATPAGGTYVWYLNGNLTGYSGNVITVNQNGTYVVVATYPGGCKATSQIIITGITPVIAHITATGSLCNGGSVTLVAGIPGNCPGAVFTWSNGFVGNPLITNVAGNYSVTITCSNGCTATSNVIPVVACPIGNGNGNCINDLVISPSNCANPVSLTTNIPAGCATNTTTWFYGDGYSNTTGIHQYLNVGTYTVFALMTCGDGTVHCGTRNITVPMVDSFTYIISCGPNGWNVQLQDASMYLPAYIGYSILWSVSPCGTLSGNNIPNPTLFVPIGCNPTITLTISKNGCTLTKSFTFNFPNTTFSILGPATDCKGNINAFSSSFTTGIISYNWTFGDIPPTTGVTNPINHAFTGNPINPIITLVIKDQYGCLFTATKNFTVIIPRALTITPSPIVKICPDCAPPVTLTTNPLAGFTNYQWYHDGVAIGAATNPTYQLCTFNASGNYYVTAQDAQNNNCPVTSDTVKVVYQPKPVADIQGSTIQCVMGNSPYNIYLQNAGGNNPNYTYSWTATGPGTVTFNPNATQYSANASVSQLGSYQFILTVTDITTGCMAKDTFCVFVYLTPTVNVSCPAGPLCQGTPYTFTATPINPACVYVWSNGVKGPVMTTSQAGMYSVTVTDTASGCSSSSSFCIINKRPNVSLFPLGCDTLCTKDTLIVPLPLEPGQTYGSVYTIKWYVDGNLYYTGDYLLLNGLTPGPHQIKIVVSFLATGCTSTSGIFNVLIINCDCDCKESHWGDITVSPGDQQGNANVGGGVQKLQCNNSYKLNCNQLYTINAKFNCKDTSCPSKVTYKLQLPDNTIQTGNIAFSFTPTQNGTYILTLYGWCGGKICDSCVIKFDVNCHPCDCKGSSWGEKTYTIDGNMQTINCMKKGDKPIDVKCKKTISINANYNCADTACNSAVTYTLVQPSGTTAGNVPLTFIANQTGIYTVTLYGWCGGKICDSCVIKFKVDTCSEPCCPYNITVKDPTIQLTNITNPDATVVNANFTITGPAGPLFTEIRAEVMSYNLFSNFNNECLNCKSYPFTWASMYQPGNVGAIPPKITMYNSTVPAFNPSGNGMYQNPREVIWSGTPPFALPNNINLSFLLPPASIIDCCELTAKICVKFTFRDKDCKECEVISCFTVVIKPGGGHEDPQECVCTISPVLSYEGNPNRAVKCGETVQLFLGNIPVNMNPGFTCKDKNGKDCAGSSLSVTITKPDNSTQVLTGPNYSYTYLGISGMYEYTITGNCNGKKCECKFKVKIP